MTLLSELDIPSVKFGRRLVYDKVDLDLWLEDYKHSERGRVGKERVWTNPKMASTNDQIHVIGGYTPHYQTAKEYAKVLGLKTKQKP